MDLLYTIVVVLYGLCLVNCNEAVTCPDGQFLRPGTTTCVECSHCPENQIVRETCWQHRDTVCGTFTEFKPFQTDERVNLLQTYEVERDVKTVTHEESGDSTRSAWQTASIVMIVLLAVTSVLCVILIATVCYRRRQDKKDGLMIYTNKGNAEATASGGSDSVARKQSSSSSSSSYSVTSPASPQHEISRENSLGRMQQFDISEDKLNT